jgi:hypothetical protein
MPAAVDRHSAKATGSDRAVPVLCSRSLLLLLLPLTPPPLQPRCGIQVFFLRCTNRSRQIAERRSCFNGNRRCDIRTENNTTPNRHETRVQGTGAGSECGRSAQCALTGRPLVVRPDKNACCIAICRQIDFQPTLGNRDMLPRTYTNETPIE